MSGLRPLPAVQEKMQFKAAVHRFLRVQETKNNPYLKLHNGCTIRRTKGGIHLERNAPS